MKKIILSCLFVISLFGSEIKWNDSYFNALIKAKKEHKPLMILVTKDSCRWCHKMEETTLKDKDIVKKLNTSFESLNLVKEKHILPKGIKPNMYPYSYFIDSKTGEIIDSMAGYIDSEEYIYTLEDVLSKIKK